MPAAGVAVMLMLLAQSPCDARAGQTDAPLPLIKELAALLDRGQLASAKAGVDRALVRYPHDAALHNIAGAIEAQQENFRSAEQHFRSAIHAAPHDASAYLNLGRLYQEHAAEDPDASGKALTVYRHLLRVEPANTEALFQAAYLAASMGEWAASRGWLEQLPAAARSRAQALALMAVDLAGLAEHAHALEAANKVLAHSDLVEEDVLAVIPPLERIADTRLAERFFTGLKARGLASPRAVPILIHLARAAYKEKDFQGSLGYLAHARDLDPENAQVHFFFGIACIELNLGADAYDSLKTAVALAPDNAIVNYAMGAVAIHRREPSEAVPYFEKYVRLAPDDPRGRFALGAARFYSNEFEAARADLEQAARSADTAAGAHYFLGRIARQMNQLDAAREEIARALEANPQYADALAELGLLQTRSGDYAAAEQSLARALAVEPDNYAATFNLASLFARTKDPRRDQQSARLEALQQKRAVAAQEFLRVIQVVP